MEDAIQALSIVVPVFNEYGNVAPLTAETVTSLADTLPYEIVFVDDCSSDRTLAELERLAARVPQVRIVRHDRNRGQSAAIRSGVRASRAAVIAVMDGDGQNDPRDIPALYERLVADRCLRMVVGERMRRRDSLSKRLSSRIANRVRSFFLRDGIRDTGCGLKVFYRDDFLDLPAFDHMHRFLPALMQRSGGGVAALPVNHRARVNGVSKYGLRNRLWVGITDLIGVLWLSRRAL